MKKPITLIIMDGFGLNKNKHGNAIAASKTPNLDKYFASCPHTTVEASGMAVGLPEGQMGNSEVGHTNIGAGRVVYQELTRITKSIADGDFFENEAFIGAIENCKKNNSALHIMGLLSDGGVHSHNEHIYGLLELAKRAGLSKVYVHCFLDGRDVAPDSGKMYVQQLVDKMKEIGVGQVATVMGRYYVMDRDNRWDRVEKAYNAMVNRTGDSASCPVAAVQASYDKDVLDEFVVPCAVEGGAAISANDSVIFANFRPDRAREITRSLVDPDFSGFARTMFPLYYVTMTQYDATMPNVHVAFKPQTIVNTFGEYVSKKGMKQLRIAETEKYAHVTFFFNGGVEKTYEGEDRALINSPKVATYDMQPEMSANLVCDEAVKRIESGKYDTIILNYANCDMVGHTGDFKATIQAVETVDTCVGKVVDAVLAQGGVALITADHGNADVMLNDKDEVVTSHSTNVVPFIIVGADSDLTLKAGKLSDLCPTMLDLMGLEKPAEMSGESLIVK